MKTDEQAIEYDLCDIEFEPGQNRTWDQPGYSATVWLKRAYIRQGSRRIEAPQMLVDGLNDSTAFMARVMDFFLDEKTKEAEDRAA